MKLKEKKLFWSEDLNGNKVLWRSKLETSNRGNFLTLDHIPGSPPAVTAPGIDF